MFINIEISLIITDLQLFFKSDIKILYFIEQKTIFR